MSEHLQGDGPESSGAEVESHERERRDYARKLKAWVRFKSLGHSPEPAVLQMRRWYVCLNQDGLVDGDQREEELEQRVNTLVAQEKYSPHELIVRQVERDFRARTIPEGQYRMLILPALDGPEAMTLEQLIDREASHPGSIGRAWWRLRQLSWADWVTVYRQRDTALADNPQWDQPALRYGPDTYTLREIYQHLEDPTSRFGQRVLGAEQNYVYRQLETAENQALDAALALDLQLDLH